MADTTTWIVVAAVVVAVVAIVLGSIVVSRRRHRLDQSVSRDGENDAVRPPAGEGLPVAEEALGDRSEIFHRARRGF
ncbi:hypothetical protein ACFJGV_11330 [Cnuibacter sp. UC19_7]|uniref:hypothetical protein n=1 Tax=Cnuibacter sp. UC19_7 TaxID=3350166 RepID=UPI003672E753